MPRPCCRNAVLALGLLFVACQSEKSLRPVPNRPPTARIDAARLSGPEGSLITFDGSASEDADGDTLTHAWVFGDGQQVIGGAVVGHAYPDEGTYAASLVVTDGSGAKDTVSAQVSVSNALPIVTFIVIQSAAVELGAAASVSIGFTDPGIADSLTARLDWGDQTSTSIGNLSTTLDHVYTSVGTYVVKLTVQDRDGGVTTRDATTPIVVSPHVNVPPVARVQGPASGREGAVVRFSARSSTDADGDSLSYTWLSGDGRVFAEPRQAEHGWVYGENGTYTVSVIVRDPDGATDTASASITVVNTPPWVVSITPPAQQARGVLARTQVIVADSSSVDTYRISIRWGDGTSDSVEHASPGWTSESLGHTYAQEGSYWIRAVVRDDDGGADSATASSPIVVFDPTKRQSVAGYDVVDLGTLGGNSAIPNDLNNRGQVVGSSVTASGVGHAFLFEDGAIKDLGTLGQSGSEAHQINDAGLIAGAVQVPADYDETRSRAAIWTGGSGRIIEATRDWPIRAAAITASGAIAWNRFGYESIFAYVWRNDTWTALGGIPPYKDSPWKSSWAFAMNERGQIVGAAPVHAWGESRIYHAAIWEADSSHDLGVLGVHSNCDFDDCSAARATDINESGQIVGYSSDSLAKFHVVLWENGTIRDLGLIGTGPLHALINDRGQIAAMVDGESFVWSNGNWRSIGSLGRNTTIAAMNEAGEIVGTSMSNNEQHVFVWSESRGMVDLGTGPQGFSAAWAVDINSRGDVIGYSAPCQLSPYSHTCSYPPETRAVMWTKR